MTGFINWLFPKKDVDVSSKPVNFKGTISSAKRLSKHRYNREDIIVVVELDREFDYGIGEYREHKYTFYSYRGDNYKELLPSLKAAYQSGKRIY